MYYKCCHFLIDGLELRYNAIAICNHVSHQGGGDIVVQYYDEKQYKNFKFNQKEYLDLKQKIISNNQISGNEYYKCKGCSLLNEFIIPNTKNTKISNIVLHHWTKCNSHCIYCYTNKDKIYFNKRKNYKALPILKKLKNSGILSKGGFINYAGGEISCLDEFEKISSFMDKMDYFQIYNSSGIKYEKTIAQHLKYRNGILIVSVDAGTKETHQKIKQCTSYDKVWENLNKYSNICTYKPLLLAKYIILKNINDNKEEICLFIDKCKKSGILYTLFDIDLYYFRENRENIPQYIIDLFFFAYTYAKKNDINMYLYTNSEIMLTQGKYANEFWIDKLYEQNINNHCIKKLRQINIQNSLQLML